MQQEIERLKRKYIFSASAIVIAVIWGMLLVMNLLMQMLFRSNSSNADAMILQAAKSYDYQTETLLLSEMKQNVDGNYLIPRNIHSVDSITLSGTIRSESNSESWYCGGGGLMYLEETENQQELVYREYTFNKDTSDVTIDFQNDNTLKRERSAEARQHSGLTADNFLVSIVWWTSREDVSLTLDKITIHYQEKRTSNDILHFSYFDLFENQIPEALSERNSFYLVTNTTGNLSAVCSGNLPTQISNEEAIALVNDVLEQHQNSGSIPSQKSYQYTVVSYHDFQIILFQQDQNGQKTLHQILWISMLSGFLMTLILIAVIILLSKHMVKPLSDSFIQQKQFISNAGHELKTPVTVISATTDLLERKHGTDRLYDTIKAQVEKMSRLITELLELTKFSEKSKDPVDFHLFSISETVETTLLYFESRAFESEHPLHLEIAENLTMYGDALKMERLVGILIDNALKYADAKTEIQFCLSESNHKIYLSCSNLCSDLTQEQMTHLFDRFYRAEESHSHQKEGFGLGLSIAQAIAEQHKGEISASLQENKITFTVKLPKS